MKKLFCMCVMVLAVFTAAVAEETGKVSPTFEEDGTIIAGSKKLSIDEIGVTHLKVADQVELIFNSHIHLDKYYLTPKMLTSPNRQKRDRDKIITFNAKSTKINLDYMSELYLQESELVKSTTLFTIPEGYKLKYAILRILIVPEKSSAPVIVSANDTKAELTIPVEKGFKRIFNKINKVTFYPDNPKLRFSLKSDKTFLLQRENGTYYLHFSLKTPCEIEIELN